MKNMILMYTNLYQVQYNIEDLTNPLRIHDSPIDVERAFADIAVSPAPLKRAAENNTRFVVRPRFSGERKETFFK